MQAVAVYADGDRDASFVSAADQAYSLSGTTASETYLDAEKILTIAARCGANAIHPGYGFLAEDATFAQAVEDAGLTWIGPGASSIAALGDKVQARNVAERVGVSPVPGTNEPLASRAAAQDFINQYDYPVVLKRADGGGGRGISVIKTETDLDNFFSGRDESTLGGFFIEKFIERGRHVETQCGRDRHGNFVVYSTRDCTVQRRHQKLIEEAPAPFLTPETETALFDASKKLFDGVDYVGLGTCEFMLDQDGSVYFLEVNPRLQVEHTVTEEVSGVDLVGQQFMIAEGKELTRPAPTRGHSFELRITSEDPTSGFSPSLGSLSEVKWPTGPGVRIDTGVVAGDEIAPDFDSMIAKLIITGENRDHALRRARRALAETSIQGVGTPIPLYQAILDTAEFENLSIWTRWLEEQFLDTFLDGKKTSPSEPAAPSKASELTHFAIEIDGRRHDLALPANLFKGVGADMPRPPQPLRSAKAAKGTEAAKGDPNLVSSPLQAIVVRICVTPGEEVTEDQLVAVLESMKMEKYVHAPRAGTIEDILVATGDNVSPNQPLVKLAKEEQ
jgi:Acetyl/propionyl-CoA carboxylase, alpha subunit